MKAFFVSFVLLLPALIYAQSEKTEALDQFGIEETVIGFSKIVDLEFDQALIKVKAELKKEKFGVLTEVDVKSVMKKKLDVDFHPYQILGVCNPPLAHKSILAEEQIGLFLPCKFIVYVNKDGKTIVAAVDPVKMMAGLENDELLKTANLVKEKFISLFKKI